MKSITPGKSIVIHFKNTLGRLILKENELSDFRREKELVGHIYGFEVRLAGGEDYLVPEAKIEGDTVILTADGPIEEIRYGFFDYGKVNLYNAAGLPVAPFRYVNY